jgi:hypothetical protein
MQNTLDRKLINKDIGYIGFGEGVPLTYDDLCVRINRVKHALLQRGVQKNDIVRIDCLSANPDSVAAFFAVAELGCNTPLLYDNLWASTDHYMNKENILPDPENTWENIRDKEFRLSDMLTPIAHGNKYHYAAGSFGREVITINYSEFVDMPDHDIEPPWDVTENDLFGLQTFNSLVYPITQKEMVDKARDCIDIFGYAGKKVVITKSQHHQNSFELCILPALMSARRIFEIPVPDSYTDLDENVNAITDRLRRTCTLMMKRNGVDLVWGVSEEFHAKGLTYISAQGNDCTDVNSRPTALVLPRPTSGRRGIALRKTLGSVGEGHVSHTKLTKSVFTSILNTTQAKSVFEIGFNQGHSARLFLEGGAKVHSVDIGYYGSTRVKMKETEEEYSDFTSELRDSKSLVATDYSGFDMVFIDGDHQPEALISDINFACDMGVPYILIDDYYDKWFSHIIEIVDNITTHKIVEKYDYDAQNIGGDDIVPNTMVLLKRC